MSETMQQGSRTVQEAPVTFLGIDVDQLVRTAESGGMIAFGLTNNYGFYQNGQDVLNHLDRVARYAEVLPHVGPVLDSINAHPNPNQAFADELGVVRSALWREVAARHPGQTLEQAGRSSSALEVAQCLGAVVGRLVQRDGPDALPTPNLRAALDIRYILSGQSPEALTAQFTGRRTLRKGFLKITVDNDKLVAAAAPEILDALGFSPEDPLVQGATEHPEWTRRFAGKRLRYYYRHRQEFFNSLPNILQTGTMLREIYSPVMSALEASNMDRAALRRLRLAYERRRRDSFEDTGLW